MFGRKLAGIHPQHFYFNKWRSYSVQLCSVCGEGISQTELAVDTVHFKHGCGTAFSHKAIVNTSIIHLGEQQQKKESVKIEVPYRTLLKSSCFDEILLQAKWQFKILCCSSFICSSSSPFLIFIFSPFCTLKKSSVKIKSFWCSKMCTLTNYIQDRERNIATVKFQGSDHEKQYNLWDFFLQIILNWWHS